VHTRIGDVGAHDRGRGRWAEISKWQIDAGRGAMSSRAERIIPGALLPPRLISSPIVMNSRGAQSDEFVNGYVADFGVERGGMRRSLLGRVRQRFRSDEEVMEQLRSGDADALTVLFERHSPLLFGIARRILRNDADAEDAVQQIFLDVYRAAAQFDPQKGDFKRWLLMFAYHRTFNRRRAMVGSRYFDTDPLHDILPQLLHQPDRLPRYSSAERGVLLKQLLQSLNAQQRRTLELVYYEGLTADEVAVRTGETVRVVRHNLYRGLAKLRSRLLEPAVQSRVVTGEDAR